MPAENLEIPFPLIFLAGIILILIYSLSAPYFE
jgi:hypothetical protein